MHTVRNPICAWDTWITDGCLAQTGAGTLLKHSTHTYRLQRKIRNSVYGSMCSFIAGEKTEKNKEIYELSRVYECAVQEVLVGYYETVS